VTRDRRIGSRPCSVQKEQSCVICCYVDTRVLFITIDEVLTYVHVSSSFVWIFELPNSTHLSSHCLTRHRPQLQISYETQSLGRKLGPILKFSKHFAKRIWRFYTKHCKSMKK
jgi:hypothetical protein